MSIQKLTSLILVLLVAGLFASDRRPVVSQKATVVVKGRICTTGELPVGGAWVTLVRRDESSPADPDLLVSLGASAAVIRARADANGRFSIELPSGLYDIRATVPGFEPFANDSPVTLVQDQEDGETFLVSLMPLTSIAGTVSGDEGDDVEGTLLAHPKFDTTLPSTIGKIERGRYMVPGLEPGSYRVVFRVAGYLPVLIESLLLKPGDHLYTPAVVLDRGRGISGVVRDASGAPVANVDLLARGGGIEQPGRSDSNGVFRITGLRAERYALIAQTPGFRVAPSLGPITIGDEDLTGVAVALNPLGIVLVRLKDVPSGTTVFAVPEVVGLSDAGSGGWLPGQPGAEGEFEVSGVPQGAYYIAARAPGHLTTYFPGRSVQGEARLITVLDGEKTETDVFQLLRGSTLSGQMVTRVGEEAIEGAVVEVISLDQRTVSTAVTDKDGRYEVSGIGVGRYLVQVRAPGYIAQFFPGVMRAEEATRLEIDGRQEEKNISLTLPMREPADFNEDGRVDVSDLERFLDQVGEGAVSSDSVLDPTQDGIVTFDDFDFVVNKVRNIGKMVDPPSILGWKSVDTDAGQIRAALRVQSLVPSQAFLAKVYFQPDEAEYVEAAAGEGLFKDGRTKVEKVGPGVLVIVGGSPDQELREGDGELVSLIFKPREGHESVRLRTDVAITLLPEGKMAAPVLPDPVRLVLPPDTFYLLQNVPNPFNPETSIAYELPEAVQVKLAIFNLVGQKVRGLVEEFKTAGRYDVRWDGKDDFGRDVGSGVYFYNLEAGAYSTTRRMLLIR